MEIRHRRKWLRHHGDLVTRCAILSDAYAKQKRERDTNGCAKVAHHLDTGDQQFVR